MQKVLVGSIAALAIAAGSVTTAGTATATGLPLDVTAPHTVQDASTGSSVGHQPSGSSLGGPTSSGSAAAAGSLIALLGAIFGDPNPCPPLLC